MASLPSSFKILPATLPADAAGILRINYQVIGADPDAAPLDGTSERAFIASGTPGLVDRLTRPHAAARNLVVKAVHTPPPSSSLPSSSTTTKAEEDVTPQLVGYAIFQRPRTPATTPSRAQAAAEFAAEMAGLPAGVDRAHVEALKTEDRVLSARFLGEEEGEEGEEDGYDYEARWWVLDALAVLPAFQRRGIGSALVAWGLEVAQKEEEGRRREGGEDEGKEVEGMYLVASPAGDKTYRKAGFVDVGTRSRDGKVTHTWFVRRF